MLERSVEPRSAVGYFGMRDGFAVFSQVQEERRFAVRWACPSVAAHVSPHLVAEPDGQGANTVGKVRACATGWFRGAATLYRALPCEPAQSAAQCHAACAEKDERALKQACREELGEPAPRR